MTRTLTRFVLELIYDEWPAVIIPDSLLRIDGNESVVLETGEARQSVDLSEHTVITATRDATDHDPEGTAPIYETVETLDVEIEAADKRAYGTVKSHAEFRGLVDKVQVALDTERSLPDPALSGRVRQPTRISMFVGDEQDRSSNNRDHYRVGFPLRLRGKLDLERV